MSFTGLLSDMNVKQLIANDSGLKGGNQPSVSVATTTQGALPPTSQPGDLIFIDDGDFSGLLEHVVVYAEDNGDTGLNSDDYVIHASFSQNRVVRAAVWFSNSAAVIKIASFAP